MTQREPSSSLNTGIGSKAAFVAGERFGVHVVVIKPSYSWATFRWGGKESKSACLLGSSSVAVDEKDRGAKRPRVTSSASAVPVENRCCEHGFVEEEVVVLVTAGIHKPFTLIQRRCSNSSWALSTQGSTQQRRSAEVNRNLEKLQLCIVLGVARINLKRAAINFADWQPARQELETRGWPGKSARVGGQLYSLHIPFP
ncbi:hypothetical protein ARMSODRAFT_1024171 [Armillaria solidipes]|uniref:Uncharacterized protein n=1 Tax=Armillaria solidipes TaxID=1076256 RepID=A0A2H3AWU3_9AGAR|nr:hypothetical protein ARMSODRAFT_1024171 [Armillaria solidipes]